MTTGDTKELPDLQQRMAALIGAGDVPTLEAVLEELHPSDIADVVESLSDELRLALVRALPGNEIARRLTCISFENYYFQIVFF